MYSYMYVYQAFALDACIHIIVIACATCVSTPFCRRRLADRIPSPSASFGVGAAAAQLGTSQADRLSMSPVKRSSCFLLSACARFYSPWNLCMNCLNSPLRFR